jgi:hypothetical protein
MSGETFWDGAPEPIKTHLNELAEAYADAPSPDVETLESAIERGLRKCRVEDGSPAPLIREHDISHIVYMVAAALRGAGLPDLCHEFIETGDCDHTDAEHDAMADRGAGLPEPSGVKPHAFVIEMLYNPGSRSEHWRIDPDWDATPNPDEARGYRDQAIRDGHRPENVRVVAVTDWQEATP